MHSTFIAPGQCPGAMGDQVTYGNGQWLGYVYDGANNFSGSNYQGYITETATFDESFCGDNCNIGINGCDITSEAFTVRFKIRESFTNAIYRITVGADDGVRLSMNGGSTYLLDHWTLQSYTEYSTVVTLNGFYNMVLDYYENNGSNRVMFSYTNLGNAHGGTIGSDQDFCQAGSADPAAFTSIESAVFLSGASPMYQWQESTDNSMWSNIPGATSETYDIPPGFSGTKYYRRRAYDGGGTYVYSNTVTVSASSYAGDEVTYGEDSWIGYVYSEMDNYVTANYRGEIFESEVFDESFAGSYTTFSTSGCDTDATTFSVRFKMRKTFSCGDYEFTIGADDGVRLSLDGGSTYVINDYSDHSYRTTTSSTIHLESGTYDLVLEYYENSGDNRVSFSYTNTASCVLPVTLNGFEVREEQSAHVLTWSTASEYNNEGFFVEHGVDGYTFDSLGWVDGYGTSVEEMVYTFTVENPSTGWHYYRLKQVDFDGVYEYSKIISLQDNTGTVIQVYPNPAATYIEIVSDNEFTSVQLKSTTDMRMVTLTQQDNRFYFGAISPGIYLLTLKTKGSVVQKKIVVSSSP